MQRVLGMRAGLQCGFVKGLRFDGPDHQRGVGERGVRLRLRVQTKLAGKLVALLGPGFDHLNLSAAHALTKQPADDGAGHVAAADESNALLIGV